MFRIQRISWMKYVKLTVTERIRSGVQKRSLANITPSSVKRASDVNITRGLRLQLLKLRQRSLRQKTVFTRYVFDCDFTTPVPSWDLLLNFPIIFNRMESNAKMLWYCFPSAVWLMAILGLIGIFTFSVNYRKERSEKSRHLALFVFSIFREWIMFSCSQNT